MPEKEYQRVRDGIQNLVSMLRRDGNVPISFQRFLEQTGLEFDRYILNTSRQEDLDYIGGKVILQLIPDQDKAVDTISIRLSAEFYFQTADERWIVKTKQGQVGSTRFTDWDTDMTAVTLQQTGTLEWSVEPPIV